MDCNLSHARFKFNDALNLSISCDCTECVIEIELLVSLDTKLGQRAPIFFVGDAVKVFSHSQVSILALLQFLLVPPVLNLLCANRIHSFLNQSFSISCCLAPGVLGTHRLRFCQLWLNISSKLLKALVSIASNTHLSITTIELIEVNKVFPISDTKTVNVFLCHLGALPVVILIRVVDRCVEFLRQIIKVSPQLNVCFRDLRTWGKSRGCSSKAKASRQSHGWVVTMFP
mmetsp:Transcript_23918/g.40630  ORF Transcript_23918/g.40630 Transcript_23918/m.40630 type:complete len:229 (+) Transcript_23918:295-981(+)